MDLSSLITLVIIVFSMRQITRGLKNFLSNWPLEYIISEWHFRLAECDIMRIP